MNTRSHRRAKLRKRSTTKATPIIITLPAEGFVRQPVVLGTFGLTKSTLWRWIAQGRFPKGIKLGPGVTAWDVATLRQHMAQLRGGAA